MKHTVQRTLALILALMMVLSVTTAFASGKTVAINKKNFPDAIFRKYVKSFDKNKDGKLSAKEIKEVEEIGLADKGISSLKGIEFFTSLEYLNCDGNKLTTLDVSKNTKLTELACSYNKLKKLDVSKNTGLYRLDCSFNKLTSLKLGKNSKLRHIECRNNKLSGIDLGGCKLLKKVVSNTRWVIDKDGTVVFSNDDAFSGTDLPGLQYDKKTKLMNGKKVLREYAKPKSIKFIKNSVTLKVHDEISLIPLLKLTPSTCIYPIKYTCSPSNAVSFVRLEGDKMASWMEGLDPGTATVTAKCGGKTAKLKVTVE